MQIPGKVPHGYRPSTAHPQHLRRSERETWGGKCVGGLLTCASCCSAHVFHSAVAHSSCWQQNSQSVRVLLIAAPHCAFWSRRNTGIVSRALAAVRDYLGV